jgi:outer membrane murein-binding lipoprotein Lpp
MAVYTAAVSVATTAAMAFNVATMGLPILIGGIIAALAAAVVGVLYFAGAFNGLSDIAKATMSGIYDAIAGGNLGLAWQIVTTGMHLAWVQFQMNLMAAWNKAVEYIMAKTETLRASWRSYMQEFIEGMNIISGGTFGNKYRGSGRAERTGKPEAKADPLAEQQKKLTEELAKLNMQASEERAKLSGGEAGKPEKFDTEAMLSSLDKGGLAGAGANAFSNTGTFSSAAVGLLGSPAISVQEKILKEAEKQTDVLEEIAVGVAVEDGVFS